MIDPRALQQHFKNVHQRKTPAKPVIPRIPDPLPLTSVQAVPALIETPPEQKVEEVILKPIIAEIPKIKSFKKEEIDLVIDEIEEIEPEIETTETENIKTIEDYDPYGYYSGPRF